jgi:hypothetical protein
LTGGKNKQKNLYINGYISKKNKTWDLVHPNSVSNKKKSQTVPMRLID